ncbi:probable G-protein coupled receptor 139 [Pomacea canaliculata]|uniref:probable G-protein coupled receptor 139 n=1 Tax=Pomacea canaliculata TaxID=400727 RepID=UPI000D72B7B4|nr:probable G-protein coupled receptor 139 [Pomacea canaliculata]
MANDITESVINVTASSLEPVKEYTAMERFLLSYPHLAAWKIASPFIVFFGTFGNVMIIVIMRRMRQGQSSNSMSLYFTALAVSDLLILYTGLPQVWMFRTFGFQLYRLHVSICKLIPFFTYSCGTGSTWLIVAMTMQRLMSVVWPHHKSFSCTERKVGLVIAMIATIQIGFNVSKIISYELINGVCDIVNEELWYYDQVIYPWIDVVITTLIPFAVLVIGNSVLLWTVIQSVKVARVMTSGRGDQVNTRRKKASTLTVTLITVSMVFLLLTMPMNTYFLIVNDISNEETIIQWASRSFAFAILDLAWFSHSAINFYIYCLTGSKFRNELKSLFCRRYPALERSKATSLTSGTTSFK